MKLETVRANLANTIAGKEQLYASKNYDNPYTTMFMDEAESAAWHATKEFLKLNINELKRILLDVDQCITQNEPTRQTETGS